MRCALPVRPPAPRPAAEPLREKSPESGTEVPRIAPARRAAIPPSCLDPPARPLPQPPPPPPRGRCGEVLGAGLIGRIPPMAAAG